MTKKIDENRVSCVRHLKQITKLLQGKWTLQILCAMRNSPVRLSQLTRIIPAASKKALRANLRALERAEIAVRRDMSGKVLHVEYSFPDDMRESLEGLVDHLEGLGRILEAKTKILQVRAPNDEAGLQLSLNLKHRTEIQIESKYSVIM